MSLSHDTFVLTNEKHLGFVSDALPEAKVASDLEALSGGWCLIALMTGVIVPKGVLAKYEHAYNFHAASTSYPGRDPHHWATLDGAASYGATAHKMTAKVDDGPIVGVVRCGVPAGSGPRDYLALGEAATFCLFRALAPMMAKNGSLPVSGDSWARAKRARRDLIAMCDMRLLPSDEVERRKFALAGFEKHWLL